jgi:hypothetical protein
MPRKLKRKPKKLPTKDILSVKGMEGLGDMVTDILKVPKEVIDQRENRDTNS